MIRLGLVGLALLLGCEDVGPTVSGRRPPAGKGTAASDSANQSPAPGSLGGGVVTEATPSFPVDAPSASASADPSEEPGPTPVPTESPDPIPTAEPTPSPTPTPPPTPTPEPTPAFTAVEFKDPSFRTLYLPPAQGVASPAGLPSTASLVLIDSSGGATVSPDLFTWISGDNTKVLVDDAGVISAVGVSSSLVEITARAFHDSAISASVFVRVSDAGIVDVEIE